MIPRGGLNNHIPARVVPPMPLPIMYAPRTASYRSNIEDRAQVIDLENRIVIIVADGAGGIVGGAAAADAVTGLVRDRAHDLMDAESCIELLREADRVVLATGGESTAVLLVVGDEGIYGASCGDSEVPPRRGHGEGTQARVAATLALGSP